jgi:hypothetical protein
MADDERTPEVACLLQQLAEAMRRRAALEAELTGLQAWVAPIRQAFGNPFLYSGAAYARPENAQKSAAHYTGQASHEVVVQLLNPIIRQLQEVTREVIAIRQQLRGCGHEVE